MLISCSHAELVSASHKLRSKANLYIIPILYTPLSASADISPASKGDRFGLGFAVN